MRALAKLSSLEQAYSRARENFEQIVGYLDSKEACGMTHSELERELEKKGRELMRKLLQEHLNNRGAGQCEPPVEGADGVVRTLVRLQERELETVFGTVSVERAGYGQQGVESLHPLDAELNLPDERYSLELRRRLAEEAAKSSFDETLQSIGKNTGGHVPKRQIEELVKRAAVDFDAFYDMRHGSTAEGQGTGSVLVTSVDGNETQIRELRRMARKNNFDLTIIVDIIHVVEYLWAAGRVLHFASGWELENWVRHRLLEILRGKAGLMAGGMRRSATRRGLSFKAREPADTCAHYLLKYSPYLRYDCYLSQGLPIATGVIEGACRHLVKDRMDVTGARWSLTGAEAVLRLRALRSSQDFDEYWAFHEVNEYERTHHTLYAGGIVPPTIASLPASKRNNLKVIK